MSFATIGLDLQEILEKRPEVEMVEVSSVQDNQEVVVDVNRDRLQDQLVQADIERKDKPVG